MKNADKFTHVKVMGLKIGMGKFVREGGAAGVRHQLVISISYR